MNILDVYLSAPDSDEFIFVSLEKSSCFSCVWERRIHKFMKRSCHFCHYAFPLSLYPLKPKALTLSLSLKTPHFRILFLCLSFFLSSSSSFGCLMSINSAALREVLSADKPLLQMKRQSDFHVNGVRMSFSSEAPAKMNSWRRERLPRGSDTWIAFSQIPHAALV